MKRGRIARPVWLQLRAGLLSGSLLLAGFSAVLLSGLAVVGLRTVAGPGAQPDRVTLREVTGEVSVPDARDGAATSARAHHGSRAVTLAVPPATDGVTTSRTDGATVADSPRPGPPPAGSHVMRPTRRPVPKPSSARSAAPTPSPTPSSRRGHGHSHGHGHNR